MHKTAVTRLSQGLSTVQHSLLHPHSSPHQVAWRRRRPALVLRPLLLLLLRPTALPGSNQPMVNWTSVMGQPAAGWCWCCWPPDTPGGTPLPGAVCTNCCSCVAAAVIAVNALAAKLENRVGLCVVAADAAGDAAAAAPAAKLDSMAALSAPPAAAAAAAAAAGLTGSCCCCCCLWRRACKRLRPWFGPAPSAAGAGTSAGANSTQTSS